MKSEAATAPTHGGRVQSSFERLCRKLSFSPKTKKADNKDGSLSLSLVLKDETESSSGNGSDEELRKKVFNFFDENGDGKITAAELQSCLTTVGGGGELSISMADAEAAIQSSDLNGDGVLDFDEFLKLTEGNHEEQKNCELRDAFALYVMEGSNTITPGSLKRMLSRLGLAESKSIDDCKAMIRPFDLNGDGVLSFEEFSLMMH